MTFVKLAFDGRLVKITSSPVPIAKARTASNCRVNKFFRVLGVGYWILFPISLVPYAYLGSQPALKTTVKPRKITVSAQVIRFNVFSALLVLLNS